MIVITEEAGEMCGAAVTPEMTDEEDAEAGTEMTTGEAEDSGTLVATAWGWVEAAEEE